jgi:hypothetical protein
MKSLALKLSAGVMALLVGEVKFRSDDHYVVLLANGISKAQRAAGCLLEPEAGDVVLTVASETGPVFILSVLTRTRSQSEAMISAPGAAIMLGGDYVRIMPRKELSISTPKLSLESGTGQVNMDVCMISGGLLENRFEKITTIARAVETVCERIVERVDRSYRRIRDFEETSVGRVRMVVEGLFQLAAKNAHMKAEKRLKMDAEKIHLG